VTRASGGTASRPSGRVGMAASGAGRGARGAGTGAGAVDGALPGNAGGNTPFGNSAGACCALTPPTSSPAATASAAAQNRARRGIGDGYFFGAPKSTVGGLLIAASFSTANCGRCL
jgi:hypothetical protein